jgi:coenzyme F420-reducing hydrogenase beta subunit
MIDFNFQEDCCGCGACRSICPENAIGMIRDEAGFAFPKVEKTKCVSCGLCERVCPHLNPPAERDSARTAVPAYLYHSADGEAKLRSSSGGAFYELAKQTVENGGTVCGCVWDENFNAVHLAGDSEQALERMQGSKYVQSDMGGCYTEILEALKAGREVLFSGTPCQAAAVYRYLKTAGAETLLSRFLSIAVICHGTAAPGAWESYRQWLEGQAGSRLVSVNFRDKTSEGYKRCHCRYEFESGKELEYPTFLGDRYIMASLVYNLCLRSCCSHCDFKGIPESCDILLGDWYADCEGMGRLGTSCIVCCSEKGSSVVMDRLENLKKIDFNQIVEENRFLAESAPQGAKRNAFLRSMSAGPYDDAEKYFPLKHKIKMLLVRLGLFDRAREFLHRVRK